MKTAFATSGSSRSARCALLGCLLLTATLASTLARAENREQRDRGAPIVTTHDGSVRGYTRDGVDIFLGIPYAAPPIGNLRWQPPQPVMPWRGTRDATRYASNCPQVTGLGSYSGPASINEDCLYLNVFTTSGSRGGPNKPVIVWIHGGGNFDGESDDYDGSKLATGGPGGVATVVVTLNYRLGLFGTFSHPAINAEGHLWGNYTILDQLTALRWVQRNIEAFGGDPKRVAVGGQSTGVVDTAVLVLSPLSRGLFDRAILESSPGYASLSRLPESARALSKGTSFAIAAGCMGSDAAAANCLRSLSAARILQLQGTANSWGTYLVSDPLLDGRIVPLQPEQAWVSGRFNKMPILGGSTKDETTFFTGVDEYFSGPPQAPMTRAQYTQAVTAGAYCEGCIGERMPAGVAALYPLREYADDPMIAYERAGTDPDKCAEARLLLKLAAQVPIYAYDFTYQNAPYYFPVMPGFKPKASHTIDIQFLFNHWHGGPLGVNLDQASGQPRELNAAESELSDQMVAAWTRFADTGNPNGTGNSPWPKLNADGSGAYLVQDIPLSTKSIAQFRADYKCDFWDEHSKR